MKFFLLITYITLCGIAAAKPTIVLTFDNLPLQNTVLMDSETRTQKYVDALREADVQTVFFAIGNEIAKSNQQRLRCIEQLVQEDHLIANHSYSHPHLSAISVDHYLADIEKCEVWIKPFATYRRWFRYPFLDVGLDPMEGASIEKAIACATALKNLGYYHGYVSIDSFDWFINMLVLQALQENKKIQLSDLEAFYLSHLQRTIERYIAWKSDEEKALFSTHVFLFHANDLNALFLPQIIAMLREKGWHIGTPDEIFDNPSNQLADFETFINLKIWEISSNAFGSFQNTHTITQEFNEQVLHE